MAKTLDRHIPCRSMLGAHKQPQPLSQRPSRQNVESYASHFGHSSIKAADVKKNANSASRGWTLCLPPEINSSPSSISPVSQRQTFEKLSRPGNWNFTGVRFAHYAEVGLGTWCGTWPNLIKFSRIKFNSFNFNSFNFHSFNFNSFDGGTWTLTWG